MQDIQVLVRLSKYFNINDDKGTQLRLSEQPDLEQESEFLAKKRTTRT